MDLTPWQRGRKKRCKRNEGKFCWFTLLKAGSTTERVNTKVDHELLRQTAYGPWVQRTYPDEKYVSSRFIAGKNNQDHPQFLVKFWSLADWPPYSPTIFTSTQWTSLCGTFYRQKSQQPLTLIWIPYDCPSLWNGTSKWWNTSAKPATHSTTAGNQSLGKIKLK